MYSPKMKQKTWYRQFWPWFLLFFPAVAVIAGVITLIIAQTHSPVMVSGDYYKEGLAINDNQRLQQQAQTLGIKVKLMIEPKTITLHTQGLTNETQLLAELQHPSFDEYDKSITFQRIAPNVYQTPTQLAKAGKWYIRLTNPSKTWEIKQVFFVD